MMKLSQQSQLLLMLAATREILADLAGKGRRSFGLPEEQFLVRLEVALKAYEEARRPRIRKR